MAREEDRDERDPLRRGAVDVGPIIMLEDAAATAGHYDSTRSIEKVPRIRTVPQLAAAREIAGARYAAAVTEFRQRVRHRIFRAWLKLHGILILLAIV